MVIDDSAKIEFLSKAWITQQSLSNSAIGATQQSLSNSAKPEKLSKAWVTQQSLSNSAKLEYVTQQLE